MEKKIQYLFSVLSMMLFLAFTNVSAKSDSTPNNLYSPVYVGDTNVTVGSPFWIQCLSDAPIEWHKDGQPIQQMHFIRHSKEDYSYSQHDIPSPDNGPIKSTIKVKHALKMHSGKYKCSMKHDKSHVLNVHDAKSILVELDMDEEYDYDEDGNLASRMSYEPPMVSDDALKSTMMMFVEDVTEPTRMFSANFDESYEQVRDVSEDFDVVDTTMSTAHPKHKLNHKHKVLVPITTEPTVTTLKSIVVDLPEPKHQHKGELRPMYENNQPYKLFTIGKPLALACNASDTTKIVWKKDDKDVKEIDDLKGHFKVYGKEGRFVIEKTREEDAGNYSCNLGDESYKFDVWAQILVKIPQNTYVVENDKLELTCIVKGTKPEITWWYSNSSEPDESSLSEIFENDHIRIVPFADIDRSRLIIDQVLLSDHGTYFCNGSNAVMYNMDVISSSDGMVRVKGKLAALWPFLGICAEVFILCTIILIYEKRRNKTDLDESDTDQSPDQKNDHHIKDSDVRHRK